MGYRQSLVNMLESSPKEETESIPMNTLEETPAEISFRNVVLFYKEELIKVDLGERATDYFSDRQRKSLVKAGVLRRVYGRGGCHLKLSTKAKRVLRQIDPQIFQ
jgi:hypothetical protein